jgi:phosphoglycolate phosphatase
MHERIEALRPFAGMPAAIRRIQDCGCPCGILSSNSTDNIHRFLQQHRLLSFDWFSCGASLFGKTARLRRLVRQIGLPPSEVFFIGDEVRDIAAANDVGVRSIGVVWGYASRDALEAAEPTFIADTPAELAEYITRDHHSTFRQPVEAFTAP